VHLCMYSQAQLGRVLAETAIDHARVTGGLMYLYRSDASFERGAKNASILTGEGLELRAVTADEAARLDPALEPVRHKFKGALFCPSDESGDARVFTQKLADHAVRKYGVDFRFNTEVTGFDTTGDTVTAIRTPHGTISADHIVMCLGVYSAKLSKQLGVRLPIYPVKGYSVTLPVEGRNNAPRFGGTRTISPPGRGSATGCG
jgi:D-amino-acid dehydrogenase